MHSVFLLSSQYRRIIILLTQQLRQRDTSKYFRLPQNKHQTVNMHVYLWRTWSRCSLSCTWCREKLPYMTASLAVRTRRTQPAKRNTSWTSGKPQAWGKMRKTIQESPHCHMWKSWKTAEHFHTWLPLNNERIQPSHYLCPASYLETGAEEQEETFSDRHCHVSFCH